MDSHKLTDLMFDDDDFFNGVLPGILNGDELPDLGDLDFPNVSINEIGNVETFGSADSNCLESLLKSIPAVSCVPPAPSVISALPGNSIIANPRPVVLKSEYNDPYITSVSSHQTRSTSAENTASVIQQLLKTNNNESVPSTTSASLGAEQKLQVIRQLLEGDNNLENLLQSTTTSGPMTPSMSAQVTAAPILSSKLGRHVVTTSSPNFPTNGSNYNTPATVNMTMHNQTTFNQHNGVTSAPALAATLTGNRSAVLTVVPAPRNSSSHSAVSKPIQPVPQSAPVQYPNNYNVDEDDHSNFDYDPEDSSNDNSCVIGSTGGRGVGRERRSSHNAIEKRYRRSINDKIDELREMMHDQEQRTTGTKMSKSCVLKKALEKMRYLMKENTRLREENTALRSSRSASESGSLASSPSNASSSEGDGVESFKSTPSSGHTSPSYPFSIKTSPVVSHAINEMITESTKIGMKRSAPNDSSMPGLSHSKSGSQKLARLLLADLPSNTNAHDNQKFDTGNVAARATFFMMSCLLFMLSPLDYLTRGLVHNSDTTITAAPPSSSRNLLWWSKDDLTTNWLVYLFHMLQWVIVGIFFVKAVAPSRRVKKSPADAKNVKESNLFAVHWAQSVKDLENSLWSQSSGQMRAALMALGSPLPVTRMALWYSCVRELCELPVNLVLLTLKKRKMVQTDESQGQVIKSDVYRVKMKLQLIQLALLDLISMSGLEMVHLLLSLWNASLECRDSLTGDDLIEMNIVIGQACRKLCPSSGRYVAKWFYGSALKQAQTLSASTKNWAWLCDELGFDFLCEWSVVENLSRGGLTFTLRGEPHCLIDLMKSEFREKLLQETLEATASGDMVRLETALRLLDTLECLALDAEVSEMEEEKQEEKGNASVPRLLKARGADNKALWWSRLGRVPILWQKEDYTSVDSIHSFLLSNSPLGRGLSGSGSMASLSQIVSTGNVTNQDFSHNTKPTRQLTPSQRFAGAVLLTYRANRRALLGTSPSNSSTEGVCNFKALHAVQQAAAVFKRDFSFNGGRSFRLWKAISLDWSLNVLASLGSSSEKDLSNFNSTLALLKSTVTEAELDPKKWLLMHEATLRMLSGGNPLRTSLILRQCSSNPSERRLQLVKELVRNRSSGSNGISVH